MLNTVSQQLAPLVAQLLVAVLSAATLAALTWIRQRVRSRLAADALSLLTSTAATLVAGAAEEVRSLKDPLQPGTWDQATAQRLRDRVVRDLRTLGAGALGDLKRTQGLDAEAVHQLLTQTVEAQVEALRRGAPVPPATLPAEALRGTDPPRAPTAPQAGYVRPGLLALLVLPLMIGLGACPPRPTPEPGPSQPVSGWTSTARAVLSTLRWALPAARAVTDSLLSDPPRTQVARALDAAADAARGLDGALDAYEHRGGDRCVAYAAAGAVSATLGTLAEVLSDNGIAIGVVLGRVVDGVASIADALIPACALDAGWTSAGDTANARLRLVEDVARRRGITLRRDLDGLTEPAGAAR